MLLPTSRQVLSTLILAAQKSDDSNCFLYLDLCNAYIINRSLINQKTTCEINGTQRELKFDDKGLASVSLDVAVWFLGVTGFRLAVKNDEDRVAAYKDAVVSNNRIQEYCEVNSKVVIHDAINAGFLKVAASDIDLLKVRGLIHFQDQTSFYISPEGFEECCSNQEKEKTIDANRPSTMDIFISHSSKDAQIAESLIELLRSALNIHSDKIRCSSVNGYRLPAGVSTEQTLQKEVHDTKLLIGVLTEVSLQSAYVLFELGARWGAQRPLISLLAAGASPSILSGPLSGINALNCDDSGQLHQLIQDVASILDLPVCSPAAYEKHLLALIKASHEHEIERTQSTSTKVEQPTSNKVEVQAISDKLVQVKWLAIIHSPIKTKNDNSTVYLVPGLGEVTVDTKTVETVVEFGNDPWVQLYDGTAAASKVPQYSPGRFIPG